MLVSLGKKINKIDRNTRQDAETVCLWCRLFCVNWRGGTKDKPFLRPVLYCGQSYLFFYPKILTSPLRLQKYSRIQTVSTYCLVLQVFLFMFYFEECNTTTSIKNKRFAEEKTLQCLVSDFYVPFWVLIR